MLKKKDLNKEERKIYDQLRNDKPGALEYFKKGPEFLETIKRPIIALTLNSWSYHSPEKEVWARQKAIDYAFSNNWISPEDQLWMWKLGRVTLPEALSILKDPQYYEQLVNTNPWPNNNLMDFAIETLNYDMMEALGKFRPSYIKDIIRRLSRVPTYKYKYEQVNYNKIDWDRLLEIKKNIFLSPRNNNGSSYSRISLLDFTKEEREKIFTEEFLLHAVNIAGNNLMFIPDPYLTQKICDEAVKKSGTALEFVPEKFQTKEMYNIAVSKAPIALRFIPREHQGSKLILKALLKNKKADRYIKKGKK